MRIDVPNEESAATYCEESRWLWRQRVVAIAAPNYALRQFAALDERLEAHVDGLRISTSDGWNAAVAALGDGAAEDVFPATVLAVEAADDRINEVVDRAHTLPASYPGVISAFGWVHSKHLVGRVKALIESRSPFHQMLGIAACGVHRRDPGPVLADLIDSDAPGVRARALRAAGELGRLDLLPHVVDALSDGKKEARFRAAWSGVLLGDRSAALRALIEYAVAPGPRQRQSLHLALQAVAPERGHALLAELLSSADTERLRIIGAGYIGSVTAIPSLIDRMSDARYARIAGEAFVNITGADVNLDQLESMPPDGFEDGPTDDPADENVEVPEDIALPWLDVARVQAWWAKHAVRFDPSSRYFLGRPLSPAVCVDVLRSGFQRQRVAAAYHRTVLTPGTPLFNTSAPAWRQQQWLERL